MMEEFELIHKVAALIPPPSKQVSVGLGDDTAVIRRPAGSLLTTVDCLVESVHFDLKYASAADVGHKALAVNLSDVAAMGGKPRWALVSLGVREGIRSPFILDLYRSLLALAKSHGVEIVGGNVSRSPSALFVDISLIGETMGKPLLRSGARAGDWLAVTGFLGSSSVGLRCLQKLGRRALRSYPELSQAHLRPQPRLDEASVLRPFVRAAIDISDGLASELHHLSKASKVRCEIDTAFIPLHPRMIEAGKKLNCNPLECALNGGEDYELLVSIPERKLQLAQKAIRGLGGNLVVIGRVSRGTGVFQKTNGRVRPLKARGHRHRF